MNNVCVQISSEWVNLNNIPALDINNNPTIFTPIRGYKYGIQVRGTQEYGPIGCYFHKGIKPLAKANTNGAILIMENNQVILTQPSENIWVRGLNEYVDLHIEELD